MVVYAAHRNVENRKVIKRSGFCCGQATYGLKHTLAGTSGSVTQHIIKSEIKSRRQCIGERTRVISYLLSEKLPVFPTNREAQDTFTTASLETAS